MIAVTIELAPLVIESVNDLVTNDVSDRSVIQILGTCLVEKHSLQNAGREFDTVLERIVKGVDCGRFAKLTPAAKGGKTKINLKKKKCMQPQFFFF